MKPDRGPGVPVEVAVLVATVLCCMLIVSFRLGG